MRIFLLFLTLFFVSCSPEKKLKQLIKKHPELVKELNTKVNIKDTIYYSKNFYYPGFKDSFKLFGDTSISKKEYSLFKKGFNYNLKVHPDTFRVHDTLYQDKEVLVPGRVIDNTPHWIKWIQDRFLTVIYLLICIGLFTKLHRKKAVN